jgi:hypothetical protein
MQKPPSKPKPLADSSVVLMNRLAAVFIRAQQLFKRRKKF